jgi:hypothetical protein
MNPLIKYQYRLKEKRLCEAMNGIASFLSFFATK